MDATSLVSAWEALVVQLGCVFTEPTAQTWQQIVLGWVLKRGRITATGITRTLGNLADAMGFPRGFCPVPQKRRLQNTRSRLVNMSRREANNASSIKSFVQRGETELSLSGVID